MLTRLEMMVLTAAEMPLMAIRAQITSALDILVHLSRTRDGMRKVTEITEVEGLIDGQFSLNTLYDLSEDQQLSPTGNSLKNSGRLHGGIYS